MPKSYDYEKLYSQYLLLPKSLSMLGAAQELGVGYLTLRKCLDKHGVCHKTRAAGRPRKSIPNTPPPPRISVSKIEDKVKSSSYQTLMREVADSIRDRLRSR